MLSIKQLSLFICSTPLIEDFNQDINKGETLAIMGPSGVGKSSLLAYVSGTLSSDIRAGGEVWLEQTRIDTLPAEQRQLGLLQQAPLLFPHMTVEENLLFALRLEEDRQTRREYVSHKLNEMGLTGFNTHLPQHLSGGQQARLALLRTLLSQPKALLLDEPFSKLDQALRQDIRQLVAQAVVQANIPAILVTHDPDDAKDLAQRTIQLAVQR